MSVIDQKYTELGERNGILGRPVSREFTGTNGVGLSRYYENGAICWHPQHGVHVIIGAIYEKWKSLNYLKFAGFPTTDEKPTPDGRGRFNHFEHNASIYWIPQTGAHEIHGDIRRKWASLGWERSAMGYPTSDEMSYNGGRMSKFEFGDIVWDGGNQWRHIQNVIKNKKSLSFLTFNTALLPNIKVPGLGNIEIIYKGRDRKKSINTLINYLRETQPDVVGLNEIFLDGEKGYIQSSLKDIYPYTAQGPHNKAISDSGLFLLSRYRLSDIRSIIFYKFKGIDKHADKGVLHVTMNLTRVLGPSEGKGSHTVVSLPIHIFITHLQNNNEGGKEKARDVVNWQLQATYYFMNCFKHNFSPSILMGDLNTDAMVPSLYNHMMNILNHPIDCWIAGGGVGKGITSADPQNNFKRGIRFADPQNSSERGLKGTRIDYIFVYERPNVSLSINNSKVMMEQTADGYDISDHYGVRMEIDNSIRYDTYFRRKITQVLLTISSFICIKETPYTPSEGDSDEPYFKLISRWRKNNKDHEQKIKTKVFSNIDSGDIRHLGDGYKIIINEDIESLLVEVEGYEKDSGFLFFKNPDDSLGEKIKILDRNYLLQLSGKKDTLSFLLSGSGATYIVNVEIQVNYA